jgi:hypothetical protein
MIGYWKIASGALISVVVVCGIAFAQSSNSAADKLYQALLNSRPASIQGFSSPTVSAIKPDAADAGSGMFGGIDIVFTGANAKAEIRYAVFGQSSQAASYSQMVSQKLTGSRIFFPFMPGADCVESSGNELCAMQDRNVLVLAIANGVARADTHEQQTVKGISAGNLVQSAVTHLQSVRASIGESTAHRETAASSESSPKMPDPCAILTSADAAAVIGSGVDSPRKDRTGTCYYQSQSAPGEGVTLELMEGGRDKFDFDRGRLIGAAPLSGIGDSAFEFASAAGFVQVYAITGSRYFTVMVFNHRDPNSRQTAANLARTIASRVSH